MKVKKQVQIIYPDGLVEFDDGTKRRFPVDGKGIYTRVKGEIVYFHVGDDVEIEDY